MSERRFTIPEEELPDLYQDGLEDVIAWGANRIIETIKLKREKPKAYEHRVDEIYRELEPVEGTLNLVYPLDGTRDWGDVFESRAQEHISNLKRIGNEDIYSPIGLVTQPPETAKRG